VKWILPSSSGPSFGSEDSWRLPLHIAVIVLTFSAVLFAVNNFLKIQAIESGPVVGTVEILAGEAERKSRFSFDFERIQNEDLLYAGDSLYVGKGSRAKLTLDNGSSFELAEGSMVTLKLIEDSLYKNYDLRLFTGVLKYLRGVDGDVKSSRLLLTVSEDIKVNLSKHEALELAYSERGPDGVFEVKQADFPVVLEKNYFDRIVKHRVEVARLGREQKENSEKARLAWMASRTLASDGFFEPINDFTVALPRPRTPLGGLWFKNRWGFFGQLGNSIVTQQIRNTSVQSGVGESRQVALRAGVGAWYGNFVAEGHWRQRLINTTDDNFSPRWLQAFGGLHFPLGRFLYSTAHLTLLGGFERYDNQGGSNTSVYLSGYGSPVAGFRTRFVFNERFETGGDFYATLFANGYKSFVQGDVRYWLDRRWSIGAGYWVDIAKIQLRNNSVFEERSYALESYLRYVY